MPQVYIPERDHPEATYTQVRTDGASLVLGAPWDQAYDTQLDPCDHSPKLFVRAPT